jgi:hypothetical protein
MKTLLKRLFGRQPKLTGRQINMWEHNSWGNALHWTDWKIRKLHGWLDDRPRVGDLINAKMKSGKIAQFIVINVELCRDPTDMFFCDLSDFGYKE